MRSSPSRSPASGGPTSPTPSAKNQGQRELYVEQVVRGAARVSLPIRRFLRGHRFSVGYSRSLHFPRVPGLSAHVVALYLSGGSAFGERLRRANYVLGGLGDRDFVRDVIEQRRFGGGHLRGYRPGFDIGDGYMLATLEYRLPIIEVERGVSTLPLYLSRAHAAVFGDLGDAFDGVPDPTRLKVGVGVEVRTELMLGYWGLFLVRAGIARGLMPGGVVQPYLVMGVPY